MISGNSVLKVHVGGIVTSNIINNDSNRRIPNVTRNQRPKPLLSSSIPQLQPYSPIIEVHFFERKSIPMVAAYWASKLSYMKRAINEGLPTDCSPRKTSLNFRS